MIKKKDLSQEDKKIWENYIKDPSGMYDKDNKNQKNIRKDERSSKRYSVWKIY